MIAPVDGNERVVELVRFAPLLQAYLECGAELQTHAREMISILADPATDEDERFLTACTLADILFPDRRPRKGGWDLEQPEFPGGPSVTPEAGDALGRMEQEETAFADRLRQAMDRCGVTQVQLAKALGIGQPAISMMLQRQCRPQRRTVKRLAAALGIAPEELWPGFGS